MYWCKYTKCTCTCTKCTCIHYVLSTLCTQVHDHRVTTSCKKIKFRILNTRKSCKLRTDYEALYIITIVFVYTLCVSARVCVYSMCVILTSDKSIIGRWGSGQAPSLRQRKMRGPCSQTTPTSMMRRPHGCMKEVGVVFSAAPPLVAILRLTSLTVISRKRCRIRERERWR